MSVLARARLTAVLLAALLSASESPSVWQEAKLPRPGAGGLEAERDTWIWQSRRFSQIVEQGHEQWTIPVSGDARPVMRRMRIESLAGTVSSPWLLSDKNYDFRSVRRLVESITMGARTEEEKALALRELLIGEGFYFHHSVPPESDPIRRLTSFGYGYCGVHSQIYDELAHAAHLRSEMCGHPYQYGHATNQVWYGGRWHFMDTDGEDFFRGPDGVIPSFQEMARDPNLVPPGDAYGQPPNGITGARYARALYTSAVKCLEKNYSDRHFDTMDFPLRKHESIEWEWQDADFSRLRENHKPQFGAGTLVYTPESAEIQDSGIPVVSPYAITVIDLHLDTKGSDRPSSVAAVGNGKRFPLQANESGEWHAEIKDTDLLYTYSLQIGRAGQSGNISGLRLTTHFRFYPPSLPYFKVGQNHLSYEDAGAGARQVKITLEWQERRRAPGLSDNASDWGWQPPVNLTAPPAPAELPTVSEGPTGTLHLVYSAGEPGNRQIVYRRYEKGNWSAGQIVTPDTQDANHPVVADDFAGGVWIAYQTGGLWNGGDVYAVHVKDGRASPPVRMNEGDPYHIAFFPSVASYKNTVAVAWEGGQPDVDERTAWGTEIGWYRTYTDGTWTPPQTIIGKPFKNFDLPKVFYDRAGRLHLTGTKGPRYYTTLPLGDRIFEWLTPEWVYHSRGGAFYEDARGDLWAAFDGQNSGSTNEIYMRMLPAGSQSTAMKNWTDAMRVSEDDKRPSLYPDIAAAGPNQVTVAWMDYRQNSPTVFVKEFRGGRWSPDMLLSQGADESVRRYNYTPNQLLTMTPKGLRSEYPHLARAGDGTLWAMWQDCRGLSCRIVARCQAER